MGICNRNVNTDTNRELMEWRGVGGNNKKEWQKKAYMNACVGESDINRP